MAEETDLKIAVVTPYFAEDEAVLAQCHASVRAQSHACEHVLVADGRPQPMFDDVPSTQHVRLPRPHGDNGNTPRAVGALLAQQQGFDAIAFLDADNWFDPDHIATMVAGLVARGDPIVACKRRFYTRDGVALDIREGEEEAFRHVDTSCWLIARPAFALMRAWSMPPVLSPVCDRIFFHAVLRAGFKITAAESRSVNFRTNYRLHYEAAGIAPPRDAKSSEAIISAANAYLASPDGQSAMRETLGFTLERL